MVRTAVWWHWERGSGRARTQSLGALRVQERRLSRSRVADGAARRYQPLAHGVERGVHLADRRREIGENGQQLVLRASAPMQRAHLDAAPHVAEAGRPVRSSVDMRELQLAVHAGGECRAACGAKGGPLAPREVEHGDALLETAAEAAELGVGLRHCVAHARGCNKSWSQGFASRCSASCERRCSLPGSASTRGRVVLQQLLLQPPALSYLRTARAVCTRAVVQELSELLHSRRRARVRRRREWAARAARRSGRPHHRANQTRAPRTRRT